MESKQSFFSRIIHIPMIFQVVIAIVLGAVLGLFMPAWFVRIFVSFNDFFGQFIGFLVPLIILSLVTASIANAEQNAGRMLQITMVAVLVSTISAGLVTLGVGEWVLPMIIHPGKHSLLLPAETAFAPFITLQLPPPLDVMSALALAMMLGLGIRATNARSLQKGISEMQNLVLLSIEKAIVPLLPLYIFGVFLKMSAGGGLKDMIIHFLWIILIIIGMLILWVLLLYLLAGITNRRNPFRLLWQMMPAGVVAFATCSSAATIPVSLKAAKTIVKQENTASFVMPLCANLHIPSVTIHFVICALAVMMIVGKPIELEPMLIYILMLSLTCVAVPGVPGGVVAVLPVMASVLGFNTEMQAVCLSLGILLDPPLTSANVLCDGALCAIVDKAIEKKS